MGAEQFLIHRVFLGHRARAMRRERDGDCVRGGWLGDPPLHRKPERMSEGLRAEGFDAVLSTTPTAPANRRRLEPEAVALAGGAAGRAVSNNAGPRELRAGTRPRTLPARRAEERCFPRTSFGVHEVTNCLCDQRISAHVMGLAGFVPAFLVVGYSTALKWRSGPYVTRIETRRLEGADENTMRVELRGTRTFHVSIPEHGGPVTLGVS